jgi:hypothetical protein
VRRRADYKEKANPQVLSEEGTGEGLEPDAATGSKQNRITTTSACVGWDAANIESGAALRKIVSVSGKITVITPTVRTA